MLKESFEQTMSHTGIEFFTAYYNPKILESLADGARQMAVDQKGIELFWESNPYMLIDDEMAFENSVYTPYLGDRVCLLKNITLVQRYGVVWCPESDLIRNDT